MTEIRQKTFGEAGMRQPTKVVIQTSSASLLALAQSQYDHQRVSHASRPLDLFGSHFLVTDIDTAIFGSGELLAKIGLLEVLPIGQLLPKPHSTLAGKALSDYTNDEVRSEYYRRAHAALGDQTHCVGIETMPISMFAPMKNDALVTPEERVEAERYFAGVAAIHDPGKVRVNIGVDGRVTVVMLKDVDIPSDIPGF